MRLSTAIEKAAPGLGCDVRVSHVQVGRSPFGPSVLYVDRAIMPGGLPGHRMAVVTVTLWSRTIRDVTVEERHLAHEQIALEFWRDVAENALLSVQLVG